jgi:hypothetical protein
MDESYRRSFEPTFDLTLMGSEIVNKSRGSDGILKPNL